MARVRVRSSAAGRRGDRGDDPLEALVNLFDLGIVLALAFLLASLANPASPENVTDANPPNRPPADAVTAREDEEVRPTELQPGERVVGRGERLGSVYRLADGRTVLVAPGDDPGAAGGPPDAAAPSP